LYNILRRMLGQRVHVGACDRLGFKFKYRVQKASGVEGLCVSLQCVDPEIYELSSYTDCVVAKRYPGCSTLQQVLQVLNAAIPPLQPLLVTVKAVDWSGRVSTQVPPFPPFFGD
jgi:hypothetical protein